MRVEMNSKIKKVFALLVAATIYVPAIASECSAVYSNATGSITLQQKQKTELSYYFNKHCKKTGEVNASSFGLDLGATVEAIPFTFSGTSTTNQQKMEEFCNTGVQQNFGLASSVDFRDEVVVASLNSFNQCVALESRGLRISHQEQAPQSVLIYGELTNNFTTASLDAIAYDSKVMKCRSTGFSGSGDAIALDGTKSLKISKNFTIDCRRTPQIQGANKFFPKTNIGLSTSLGPYSIELMEDQLFGFASASQAKVNYDKVAKERDTAVSQKTASDALANNLQQRINNSTVSISMLSIGEYSPPQTAYFQPRMYCYTDPNARAKEVCGERRAQLHNIGGHDGNKCGYAYYVITCLAQ
jgi:hypothetical protein